MERNEQTDQKNDFQFVLFSPPLEGSGEAHIRLNRPSKHNSIIPELLQELDEILDQLAVTPEIKTVVLSGNGPSFCAGADLNWFASSIEKSHEQNETEYKLLANVLQKLYELPQITIAAVSGNILGGGNGLMAACDLILADESSVFSFSEINLGIIPATILPFVAQRIPMQKAKEWIFSGKRFSAGEALQAGLIDRITPDLEQGISGVLKELADKPSGALRSGKALINKIYSGEITVRDGSHTAGVLAGLLQTGEARERINSFLKNRISRQREA
jgi:methylglutaconyl-CoA hydratase